MARDKREIISLKKTESNKVNEDLRGKIHKKTIGTRYQKRQNIKSCALFGTEIGQKYQILRPYQITFPMI